MRPLERLAREWRELIALLRSRAVILGSILLLTSLYAAGLLVPQRPRLDPRAYEAWRAASPRLVRLLEVTGLTDVFRSPVVYVATGLFFASLLAVIAERVPRLVRSSRLEHGIPLDPAVLARRKGTRRLAVAEEGEALQRAAGVLEACGYRVVERAGAVRGVRFRRAPLGFLAFHGSFGLILAGALALDLTRYSAGTQLGEGEGFDTAAGPFRGAPRPPRAGALHPELAFQVLEVRPVLEDGKPTRLGADVLLAGETLPRHTEVSGPVKLGTTSVLITGAGPAPLFTCAGPGGQEGGAWVKLRAGGDRTTRFELAECGLEVIARPVEQRRDAGGGPGGVMLQSTGLSAGREALDRGVEVALREPGGAVTRAVVLPGGRVTTAAGDRSLGMPEVRLYGTFEIVDERGGGLLWAGFVAAVVGLLSRLVFFRREVVAAAHAGALLVAASADGAGLGAQDAVLARLERLVSDPQPRLQPQPQPEEG